MILEKYLKIIWKDIRNEDHEKYEEHDINSKRYDGKKSYLTISEEKAQKLINEKAGTGELRRDRKGNWTKKEFIKNEFDIGFFISKDGNLKEKTDRYSINYNNKGQVHIIPRRKLND